MGWLSLGLLRKILVLIISLKEVVAGTDDKRTVGKTGVVDKTGVEENEKEEYGDTERVENVKENCFGLKN